MTRDVKILSFSEYDQHFAIPAVLIGIEQNNGVQCDFSYWIITPLLNLFMVLTGWKRESSLRVLNSSPETK